MAIRFHPMGKGTFTVSSPFGMRDGVMHNGIDFAAPKGTPIYAPADGLVVEGSERNNVQGFGKWVWLDCQKSVGADFIMGHCDPLVKKNQTVRAGDLIARVNTHGESTGPHNHFEVWSPPGRIGGKPYNPQLWLDKAQYVGDKVVEELVPAQIKNPITREDISPNRHEEPQNISWFAIHTQQGRGKARDIIPFLNRRSSQVSYHFVVDDEETVLNVPLNWCPWSATNANSRAIHILMAGTYAEWELGKWLEKDASDGVNEDLMLSRTAELVAWLGQKYPNVPLVYVGGGSMPPRQSGVCGHVDFGQWGGGHWDPGNNFPWNEFMRRVTAFAEGGTVGFLDETLKNFKGKEVSVRTLFYYVDQFVNEVREQLVQGWPQLGKNDKGQDLTIVDNLAAKDQKLDAMAGTLEKVLAVQQSILQLLQEEKK